MRALSVLAILVGFWIQQRALAQVSVPPEEEGIFVAHLACHAEETSQGCLELRDLSRIVVMNTPDGITVSVVNPETRLPKYVFLASHEEAGTGELRGDTSHTESFPAQLGMHWSRRTLSLDGTIDDPKFLYGIQMSATPLTSPKEVETGRHAPRNMSDFVGKYEGYVAGLLGTLTIHFQANSNELWGAWEDRQTGSVTEFETVEGNWENGVIRLYSTQLFPGTFLKWTLAMSADEQRLSGKAFGSYNAVGYDLNLVRAGD